MAYLYDILGFIYNKFPEAVLGVFAGLVILPIVNSITNYVKYIRHGREVQKRFGGIWHSYHRTFARGNQMLPIWSHHVEELKVRHNLSFKGRSTAQRNRAVYIIEGCLKYNELMLEVTNPLIPDDRAQIWINNIIDPELWFGILVAKDYDSDLYASPIFISRTEIQVDKLDEFANRYFGGTIVHEV